MIHRKKPVEAPEALLDTKWDKIKADALSSKYTHDVKGFYRDTTIGPLTNLYKDKCAICERKRGTELQVDHYRPKKPRNNKEDRKYNQPGYYWLAYEWSNLIPLCSKCNNKKSNKFPLKNWDENNRISNHINVHGISGFDSVDLKFLHSHENPLILNPELEKNPERHFRFNPNGEIVGCTEEGEETIQICDLNRKDLRRERIEISQGFVDEIQSAFDDYGKNYKSNKANAKIALKGELNGIFKRLYKGTHIDHSHSLFCTFLYFYFNEFIDSKLPSNLKGQATKYFKEFSNYY